jgi:rhodanese-related sulfurtransferase
MTMGVSSLVLAFPPAAAAQSLDYLAAKLRYYADSADVAEDLRNGIRDIVVIDTRASAKYAAGHIPGALSFPHRLMDESSTTVLDRDKVYVTYCDGIGCNGSTQGAYKLATLGFRVKELIGGLDFWLRDGHPLAIGEEQGTMFGQEKQQECGC